MPRKSFKNNPALQFISEADNDPQENSGTIQSSSKTPDGYKINPVYIETKTRRLQIVLQPSLYERVKKAAAQETISVNEFIHRTLNEATKNNL